MKHPIAVLTAAFLVSIASAAGAEDDPANHSDTIATQVEIVDDRYMSITIDGAVLNFQEAYEDKGTLRAVSEAGIASYSVDCWQEPETDCAVDAYETSQLTSTDGNNTALGYDMYIKDDGGSLVNLNENSLIATIPARTKEVTNDLAGTLENISNNGAYGTFTGELTLSVYAKS